MRYISLILLCIVSLATQAQSNLTIKFKPGDHIYYMEHESDTPIHYQVEGKIDQEVMAELTKHGVPQCHLAFDPVAKKIHPPDAILTEEDGHIVIQTPHLARATSFKICTNNRVFVLVTNPVTEIKL
ncbi:MAG: hypothetical protein V2B15_06545 [Bacteroidota bacterium]